MLLLHAHLVEELVDLLLLGHERDGPQDLVDVELLRARQRVEQQQVLAVDEADDVVDVVLVHRHPRVAVLLEQLDEVAQLVLAVDGDDVRARDHDLAHGLVPDLDDPVDHLVLLLLDHALLFGDVQQREELLLSEIWGPGRAPSGDGARDDRDRPQDRAQERRDAVDRHCRGERPSLRLRDGQRLRRDLGQDQKHDRERDGNQKRQPDAPPGRHAGARENRVAQQRGRGRGDDQSEGIGEQHRR